MHETRKVSWSRTVIVGRASMIEILQSLHTQDLAKEFTPINVKMYDLLNI